MTAPDPRPPARPPASGVERIVAVALAAMAVVLGVVWVDGRRSAAGEAPPPFDFENPLLGVATGECVEVAHADAPDVATWFVVRSPGPVLRPRSGPATVEGWTSPRWPDARSLPPYLVCDTRPGARRGGSADGASPPPRDEPMVFGLNGFGLPLEAQGVLRGIGPQLVDWGGQRRRGYAVEVFRYGAVEGPWIVHMAAGVPALGTMMRTYLREARREVHVFRVPETCR